MHDKYLKIGFLNVGSLGTKHDDFIASVASHSFDIVAVNETWLRPGEEGRAPTVPGYRLRHTPRPLTVRGGRGGGVGFYLKRGLTVRACSTPTDPRYESIEQMWITLSLNGVKLAIGTAYRPPRSDLDLFLDAITDTISSLTKCDHYVLLGDFNVNMLNTGCQTLKVCEFLNSLSLKQLVDSPTHFTDHSQTLIDLVCTNINNTSVCVEPFGAIHGHSLVICKLNIKRSKYKPHTVAYRPITKIDRDKFDDELAHLDWEVIRNLPNVNDMVEALNRNIVSVFDKHAPVKTCLIKDHSHPWITDTIKFMMHLRNEALAKYRKIRSESKKVYYKQLKSLVSSSLFYEKVAYFKQNINNKINEPKTLWKNLKSTVLPPKPFHDLPSHFRDPDQINSNFLNVPGNPISNVTECTFFESHRFSDTSFSLHPVSTDQVLRYFGQLKSNAGGYDGITLDMITLTFPHTIEVITDIVNKSIVSATFPDIWKIASVRPLPKITNPTELKDLRPISILPCLSKIAEKAICQQLSRYLEENNILPELQSGFRKRRGTSTALLDVTDNILSAQDKGMCTLLVLLDFSRAFDCINIELLLCKLKYYGFDDNAIKWFQSYLYNRQQRVEVRLSNGSTLTSSLTPINRGVPQGSILGPLIFILYCADIINSLKRCRYHIYADDVQVYISFDPREHVNALRDLNEDLNRIAGWAEVNGLVLNPTKTKYMLFGTKSQISALPSTIHVVLMGELVERVTEARNLGLTMDAELRYEAHVAKSVRTCFYRLRILYKIRPYLSEELRVRLVESLVLSNLNYADTVYGPRLLARTERLIQRVQNACARFCFKIPPRSHVTPFINQHSILKMKSRRKLHLACLLFGVIKYQEPSYLYKKLSWIASKRQRPVRQCSQQLSTEPHSTAAFRGSFRYAATKCWNNIPPPIRNIKTLGTFRTHLRKFLIDSQKELGMTISNTSII
uniref:Reverse transcriptase domain-containing protein n=1 Tax=Heliothis virescens TaxID=7102 RepID=A0A2A4KAV4_HELVI